MARRAADRPRRTSWSRSPRHRNRHPSPPPAACRRPLRSVVAPAARRLFGLTRRCVGWLAGGLALPAQGQGPSAGPLLCFNRRISQRPFVLRGLKQSKGCGGGAPAPRGHAVDLRVRRPCRRLR
ncbi:hypothetical protein MILUP08_44234 [Micromonospora lupini str. Lupac 08]|uniref:Uncharacterized protein n=1 Tax=Micromonospora lupini str. Lupac 08 TaxID=1150864 RepID=I0L669_9ACTN|nr:hypothetical protein MILUP08_44234 [Micromonospora lupini str. Lupac 08]